MKEKMKDAIGKIAMILLFGTLFGALISAPFNIQIARILGLIGGLGVLILILSDLIGRIVSKKFRGIFG